MDECASDLLKTFDGLQHASHNGAFLDRFGKALPWGTALQLLSRFVFNPLALADAKSK